MAAPQVPFANDGSFLDKFKEMQQGQGSNVDKKEPEQAASSSKDPAQPTADDAANQQKEDADFLPSTSFSGAREGYAFTTGDKGTGYYKDIPLHLRAKQKAKPVALKSSSIVKGLQRRTAVAPDPKRQKKDDSSAKPSYLKEMERYKSMACSADTKHDRPLVK